METRAQIQNNDGLTDIEQQLNGLKTWVIEELKPGDEAHMLKNFLSIIILYLKITHSNWESIHVDDMSFTISDIRDFILKEIFTSDYSSHYINSDKPNLSNLLRTRFMVIDSNKKEVNFIKRLGEISNGHGGAISLYALIDKKWFINQGKKREIEKKVQCNWFLNLNQRQTTPSQFSQ